MKHIGKIRSMASVYLRRDDKLLLLFRQGNSIVSNLWIGSAGGHFEEAELRDARACVLRELYEELSINENALENLWQKREPYYRKTADFSVLNAGEIETAVQAIMEGFYEAADH